MLTETYESGTRFKLAAIHVHQIWPLLQYRPNGNLSILDEAFVKAYSVSVHPTDVTIHLVSSSFGRR